jgi:hypothetical protein
VGPVDSRSDNVSKKDKQKCHRCDGDGRAHGSDRPFQWTGPWTYPGACPVCNGSGVEPNAGYIPEGYYFKDDLDGGRLVKKEKS